MSHKCFLAKGAPSSNPSPLQCIKTYFKKVSRSFVDSLYVIMKMKRTFMKRHLGPTCTVDVLCVWALVLHDEDVLLFQGSHSSPGKHIYTGNRLMLPIG